MTCGQLPLGGCWLPITHSGKCVNPEIAELVWEQMQRRVIEALVDSRSYEDDEINEAIVRIQRMRV